MDHRKSKRVPEKHLFLLYIDYVKAFDGVDHNKLWKILQQMRMSDHLTCLLRNLYAGQKTTVRTRREKTDWLQIKKGVCQGCIYIMRNARLDETQAGIKIAGRNINNLIYAVIPSLWQKAKRN